MGLMRNSTAFRLQSLTIRLLLLFPYLLAINAKGALAADAIAPLMTTSQNTASTIEFNSLVSISVIVVLLITVLVAFIKKRNKSNLKYILHHQYAYFDQQDNNGELNLYKRHEKKHSLSLSVNDICEYNILLNDINLSTINSEKQGDFSANNEADLRKAFAQEQQHKMVDERIRKLTVILTDIQSKKYVICFYLRQGNQRLTKTEFKTAIEEVVNWCWFFNESINPNSEVPENMISKVDTKILSQTSKKQAPESDENNSCSSLSTNKSNNEKIEFTDIPLKDNISQNMPMLN